MGPDSPASSFPELALQTWATTPSLGFLNIGKMSSDTLYPRLWGCTGLFLSECDLNNTLVLEVRLDYLSIENVSFMCALRLVDVS